MIKVWNKKEEVLLVTDECRSSFFYVTVPYMDLFGQTKKQLGKEN